MFFLGFAVAAIILQLFQEWSVRKGKRSTLVGRADRLDRQYSVRRRLSFDEPLSDRLDEVDASVDKASLSMDTGVDFSGNDSNQLGEKRVQFLLNNSNSKMSDLHSTDLQDSFHDNRSGKDEKDPEAQVEVPQSSITGKDKFLSSSDDEFLSLLNENASIQQSDAPSSILQEILCCVKDIKERQQEVHQSKRELPTDGSEE